MLIWCLTLVVNYNMKCVCCRTETLPHKELEKTSVYKCEESGLSNSRLKEYSLEFVLLWIGTNAVIGLTRLSNIMYEMLTARYSIK
jgi:hypothetical protein